MKVIKTLFRLIVDVINGSKKDNVGIYSAQTAFFVTISFIPFIMLLISIIKFLPVAETTLVESIVTVFPAGAKELVSSFVTESYEKSDAAVISITAVSALWAASVGIFALVKGLNKIFCENEGKSFITLRILSMIYTLFVMAILILCLGVFVFGNTITENLIENIPYLEGAAFVFFSFRVTAGTIILGVFFVVMYTVVPRRKTKFKTQIPGALLSSVSWVAVSGLFSYYYENISDYSYLYGSLSVMMFFMLWLFLCMYTLFLGAEVNKCIERRG